MDALASTEFRKRFARLTQPTLVTVNGHEIGVWTPATTLTPTPAFVPPGVEPRPYPPPTYRPVPKPAPKARKGR